jgi:hypothetical protein
VSDPLSYARFIKALKDEGLTVYEHKTDGASPQYHNRNHKGAWGPLNGIVVHHTVTRGHDSTISICRLGHATLPGPLCHGVICKLGHVHVVGYGRANHAGLGDDDVLRAVVSETSPLPPDNEANTDGNRHFYGFECENLGDGNDPWPEVQLDAIERACAALARAHGWSERSVIGHLEWQPGKVDPRGFSMNWMRDRIKNRLDGTPAGQKEEDVPVPLSYSVDEAFSVESGVWTDVKFGAYTDLIKDKQAYTLTAYLRFQELPLGSTVQGRFVHRRPDGSEWRSPLVERPATDGSTFADFTNSGSVVPTEAVRFEFVVFVAGGGEARVSSGYARGLCWE